MRKILVTGASGFIGRRLAPLLVKTFSLEEVVCLVHASDSEYERAGQNVLDEHHIPYQKIELRDPLSLKGLPKDFSHIIHLAATTDTDSRDFSANDIGTENLFKALGVLNPGTQVIFPGSSTVYAGRHDVNVPVTLATPLRPTNEYARTKLRAEEFLARKATDEGFNLIIARFNTVYGSRPRENSLLFVLRTQIMEGSMLARLNWPGRSSIIHVDDVCRRIMFLVRRGLKSSNELYLFSSESLTLAQMYEIISRELRVPYRPIELPRWFWLLTSLILRHTPYFEQILPSHVYTMLWRGNLVVANVLEYEPNDLPLKDSTTDHSFQASIREIFI